MNSIHEFPAPDKGTSLLLAFHMKSKLTIIIGTNTLAAQRVFTALEADSDVIVLGKGGRKGSCREILWRADQGEIELFDFDDLAGPSDTAKINEIAALELFIDSRAPVALVFVTDTLMTTENSNIRTMKSASQICSACRLRNIPVNVADIPELSDFSFTASHRFLDPTTNTGTSLQVGVTTNGKGCRLSGRIKREIVAGLSKEAGVAVEKIGKLRNLAKSAGNGKNLPDKATSFAIKDDMTDSKLKFEIDDSRRRMNWVAQISEYWSLSRIASMTDEDISNVLRDYSGSDQSLDSANGFSYRTTKDSTHSRHSLDINPRFSRGRILLVGSGPGHPRLLTVAAQEALAKEADLVLSDKLVPEAVLALIPSSVEVRIARKFPGNNDKAQSELMEAAVEAARSGKTVVRLKQGEPMLYGRGGEEVLYFRQHGFEAVVIPGISSALAAPTFANIPVTQRGVSESFVVCTGIGRQGKEVKLPGYQRSRTLVLLMGVTRLAQILTVLQSAEDDINSKLRDGVAYPSYIPVALIERASMPDQRVIASTLQNVLEAIESSGEQRPPGLLVIGWTVLALWELGNITILDDQTAIVQDLARIDAWLEGKRWRVSEGLNAYWSPSSFGI